MTAKKRIPVPAWALERMERYCQSQAITIQALLEAVAAGLPEVEL